MKKLIISLCLLFTVIGKLCSSQSDNIQSSEPPIGYRSTNADFSCFNNSQYIVLTTQSSSENFGIWGMNLDNGDYYPVVEWDEWIRDLVYVPQTQTVFALSQSGDILYFGIDDSSEVKIFTIPSLEEGELVNSIDFASEIETVFVLTNSRILGVPLINSDGPSIIYPICDDLKRQTINSFSISPNGLKYVINSMNVGYYFERESKNYVILPGTAKFWRNDSFVLINNDYITIQDINSSTITKQVQFGSKIYGISLAGSDSILVWTGKTGFTGGAELNSMSRLNVKEGEIDSLSIKNEGMRTVYVMISDNAIRP